MSISSIFSIKKSVVIVSEVFLGSRFIAILGVRIAYFWNLEWQ